MTFPLSVKIYLSVLCFVLGTVMGSALNCLAYRIAHKQKWTGGRSVCPVCGHTLKARDLVPLLSWLLLKGRCRYCKTRVSVRYPVSELVLGLSYLLILSFCGFSLHTLSGLILVSCLFCLSLIDLDVQLIPDRFIIIPAVVRAAELFVEGGFAKLGKALLPALAMGGGILILTLIMDKLLKKETMGGGDIKLLFMLGMYFSVPACLLLLIFSCVIGLITAVVTLKTDADKHFPFGPAISAAAFIVFLCGDAVTNWYLGLFNL